MFLTVLDIGLIVIMLVSGLLAMMRGLTREILSIASWAAAAAATLFAYNSSLKDWALAQFGSKLVAYGALIAGTFFVTLVVVGFITARISDAILDSRIGALDRATGFLFGLFRGLVIVVIGYFFFNELVPPQAQPGWIANAQSRPALESVGKWAFSFLPDDPEGAWLRPKGSEQGETTEQPQEPDSISPKAKPAPPQAEDEVPDESETPVEGESIDDLLKKSPGNKAPGARIP